jgi:hypothetical protein
MSKEFIEQKIGSTSINKARKQQKQLSYFTQSEIQEEITSAYIEQWAERNYVGNDDFLNWIKAIFKEDNFLSFYKYFRNPLASARLVNDRVKPQLKRVFYSEDSYFKYIIGGEEVGTPEDLDVQDFNEWMFNALLFRHNDVLVTDLEDVNTPFRQLVSIENIVALESTRSVIHRIAYSASVAVVNEDGSQEVLNGFLYIDSSDYIFYDKDLVAKLIIPHDLGECPADYVSKEPFANDDIVRKSIFSFVREQFEEYVFLKTLQRMTEPNGAIPIVTKLQDRDKNDRSTAPGSSDKQPPMSANIQGQKPEFQREVAGKGSSLQAGTIINTPIIKKDDGSIDMDVVQNYLNFFFIPVESLNYLKDRIIEIEKSLIVNLIGESKDQSKDRRNEIDVKSDFISAEDKLRHVSAELSRIRERSDYKFLALQHGKDRVQNEAFYGSDFFLETQKDLYDLFELTPNPIERREILLKIARNRNRFNKDKAKREEILYSLMPYASDEDFDKANEKMAMTDVTFQYQTRFTFWINAFEAEFGDILLFWESMGDDSDSEKLIQINNLIVNIIEKAIVPIQPAEQGDE